MILNQLQILGVLDKLSDIIDGDKEQKKVQAEQVIRAIQEKYCNEDIICQSCNSDLCTCNFEPFWYNGGTRP